MPTELQSLAIKAVAAADPVTVERLVAIAATKAVRAATGVSLHEAKLAVEWALANPTATEAKDLPVGSIVATGPNAWVKEAPSTSARPWVSTAFGSTGTDAEVNALLQAGTADVLRVGFGGTQ